MSDAVVGKEVDGYRIQSVLGRGGMGTVYKAEDVNLSRTVAIKRINPGQQERESFIHRFRSEAQALARIDSPNIVGVYALRETDIGLLIVMEYVAGGTLKDPIDRQGAIAPSQAVPILEQTLEAFHDAHSAGVIHRDIKPENVMLTQDGMVKVTDFGIAKLRQPDSGETVTQGGQGGTLKYMSPEQISNISAVDARSDIYSLGMTAYEILSGSLPFTEADTDFDIMRKVVEGEIPPPDEFNADIPSGLAQWVMGAIEKQQEDRYQSAEEMLTALREADQQADHTMTQPAWEIGDGGSRDGPTETVVPDEDDDPDASDRTQTVVPGNDDTEGVKPGGETVVGTSPPASDEGTDPPASDPQPDGGEGEKADGADATPSIGFDEEVDAPTTVDEPDPSASTDEASADETGTERSRWPLVVGGLVAALLFAAGGYFVAMQMGGGGTASSEATLSLTTAPVGATVVVNGDTVGTTPVKGYAVKAGPAQLEIRKQGFVPLDTTVTAGAGAQMTLKNVALTRRSAQTAAADGAEEGNVSTDEPRSPPTASASSAEASTAPTGRTEPDRSDNTSEPEEESPSTPPEAPVDEPSPSENEPAEEQATGTVAVTPRPSGTVLIDGEATTGSGSAEVPVGTHTVTCRHPERGSVEKQVTVEKGQTRRLTCYFEQKVNVNTTGAYGRIWLNGTDTGRNTNATRPLSLPPGTHQVEVRRRSIQNFQVDGGMVKVERGGDSTTKDFSGTSYTIQVEPTFEKVEHAVVFNVSTP